MRDNARAVVGKVLVGLAVAGFAGALGVTIRSLTRRLSDDVHVQGANGERSVTPAAMLLDGERLVAVPAAWDGPRALLSARRADVGSPRVMHSDVLASLPPVGAGQRSVTLAASRSAYLVTIAVPYQLRGTYSDGADARCFRITKDTHDVEHVAALDIVRQGKLAVASGPEGFAVARFDEPSATADENATTVDDVFVLEDGKAPRYHEQLSDAIVAFAGKRHVEASVVSLHVAGGQIVAHLRAAYGDLRDRSHERVIAAPFAGGPVRVLAQVDLRRPEYTADTTKDRLDVRGAAASGSGVWLELHRADSGATRTDTFSFVPLDGSPPRTIPTPPRVSVTGSTPPDERPLTFVAGEDLVYAACPQPLCEAREVSFVRLHPDGGSRVLDAPYPSGWQPSLLAADDKDAFVVTGSDFKRLRL